MTMQIIEITDVHKKDVRYSYVKGCIFCIDDETLIYPTRNPDIGNKGFYHLGGAEVIGTNNPCGQVGDRRIHYAVKYKILFGVR